MYAVELIKENTQKKNVGILLHKIKYDDYSHHRKQYMVDDKPLCKVDRTPSCEVYCFQQTLRPTQNEQTYIIGEIQL